MSKTGTSSNAGTQDAQRRSAGAGGADRGERGGDSGGGLSIAASKWKEVPLGCVCRVIPGYAFKSKDWCDEGIPVIKIKNIQSDRSVDTNDADCVPRSIYSDRLKKFVLEDGDILLAMTGATAGKVGKLRTKEPMLLNQRVAKIKPVEADPDFIWAIVSSDEYQEKFFHLADGAAQPNMSGGQIERLPISLPDLSTQRRIAGILSAYDDLIENNLRRIKIVEEMAQSLYREWFVHFRFPGHESVPLVDSPLGPIPGGWEVKPLFDVATVKYGKMLPKKDLKPDGEYPVYGAAKVIGHYDRFTREDRTIICGCRGSVGEMQITEPQCYVTNNSFTFDPLAPEFYFWLFYALSGRGLRDVTGGAAQPQITLDGISQVTLATPDAEVLKAFEARARGFANLRWNLESRNQNLRQTRDLLLPKLLSQEAFTHV